VRSERRLFVVTAGTVGGSGRRTHLRGRAPRIIDRGSGAVTPAARRATLTSRSMTVRFSPSRVSNERWRSRPLTITRIPRVSDSAVFSAACRQMLHRRKSASPSFHSPV